MLVSRASKLAITALMQLASRGTGQWVKVEDLSNSIRVDRPFLLQIMNRLVRQGIIRSKRGRQGGFQMAVSPGGLTLGQIACAVEGSSLTKRCLFNSEPCDGADLCLLALTWHPIRKMLLDFLNNETIQTVAERDIEQIDRFDISLLDE